MIYLTGSPVPVAHPNVGWMLTPRTGRSGMVQGRRWAADNGCYARPQDFSWDTYLSWLERNRGALFATSPDVVGDAWATLERYGAGQELIRSVGHRPALVAQDGLVSAMVPWDLVDCLFIGGTTEWKVSEDAYALVAEGRRRGVWVHAGRVNSFRRLKAFRDAGAHSADGNFLKYAPDHNVPRMLRWLQRMEDQPSLLAD